MYIRFHEELRLWYMSHKIKATDLFMISSIPRFSFSKTCQNTWNLLRKTLKGQSRYSWFGGLNGLASNFIWDIYAEISIMFATTVDLSHTTWFRSHVAIILKYQGKVHSLTLYLYTESLYCDWLLLPGLFARLAFCMVDDVHLVDIWCKHRYFSFPTTQVHKNTEKADNLNKIWRMC